MNYYTIILMYTISDNQNDTRNKFKSAIKDTYEIEELDQSTLALKTNNSMDSVYKEICSICDKLTFSKYDRVSLYCAATYIKPSVCEDKLNKIVRYEVIPKAHNGMQKFRPKAVTK